MTDEILNLPKTNPHRSETPVRQLDATDLDILVPATGNDDETNIWEELHDAINTLPEDGVRTAVATVDATIATAIDLQKGSSRPIHAIELGAWKAYSETQSPVTHVLVQASDENYTPCGRCLQTLLDYSSNALVRITSPSNDRYYELSLDQSSILYVGDKSSKQHGDQKPGTDTDSGNNEDDASKVMSIPESPPYIDVEVDDGVEVEFVRLNAPVYHLKYQTHNQTFCGTDLTHRESVSSSEEPNLLDPCKSCYGATNRVTVEEQRVQLRSQLGERVDSVRSIEEDAATFNENEIAAILNRLPVEKPSGGTNSVELRSRLSRAVVDVHADQENPLMLSRAEMESLLAALDGEGTIPNTPHLLVHTSTRRIARIALSDLNLQHRGGKGELALSLADGEVPTTTLAMSPREQLYLFTNLGQVHHVDAHRIPVVGRGGEPVPLPDIINFNKAEALQAAFTCRDLEDHDYVVLGSREGYIKRTATKDFENIRRGGIRAVELEGDDLLQEVCLMDGDQDILMSTQNGRAIRFNGTDVRPMGREARGVKGIEIDNNDEVVTVNIIDPKTEPKIFTVTAEGYGKRTAIEEYRSQSRMGRGLIDISTGDRNGPVVTVVKTSGEEEFVAISEAGRTIRAPADDISVVGRNTMGVEVMELNSDDLLSNLTVFDC